MPKNKKKTKNILITLLIMVMVSLPSIGFAGTYWVSPAGSATWANCRSSVPLSGTLACSLATANKNAVAGDVVNLRGGTYNTQIEPSTSGTSSSNRIIYQAYTGETPIISKTGLYNHGIFLNGKDYIKIDGVTITNVYRWANIRNGADHNEVTNCTFSEATSGPVFLWGQCQGGASYNCHSTHNWIHNNTFYKMGWVTASCDDQGGLITVGSSTTGDSGSNNNTIENNIFYWGGHHLIETFTKYNILRNNLFHNEGWITNPGTCEWGPSPRNGKYGNRGIQIYDGHNAGALYNLIEGNRLGHAAFASDGGMDGNLVITSQGNIVRYNASYYSETMGLYFKQGAGSNSSNNRVYNNTIFASGQDSSLYPNAWTHFGDLDWRLGIGFHPSGASIGNALKNNIIYNSYAVDINCNSACQANNTLANNWVTTRGNPLFVNPNVSDPMSLTLPNLNLQSGSKAIDGGIYLTQTKGFGNNSTTLVVNDALYFQDGTWGSALSNRQADWIAIRDVGNKVQIKSINYSTNTITLASPMTWGDRANIWLYKRSDGTRVIYGSAPDFGAYEFNSGDYQGIATPQNPRPQ